MRGRRPAPTALKILRGAQKCRINGNEPRFSPVSERRAPSWLGKFGSDLWRRLMPVLAGAGLLTEGDMAALELLCDEYDIVRRDPEDALARDRLRKLLVEFGLTPASRSRLKVPGEKRGDELEEFLVGGSKQA